MGAGVSNWCLANAVSKTGQLGVVSGTALDVILVRRLQDGDFGGHVRRALAHFPFPKMVERILREHFIDGGKAENAPYRAIPMHKRENSKELNELCMVANFVEVFLAREGHANPVGINYLEKIQLSLLPGLYGAMLAGVEYVLVGAGIPVKLPGAIDQLAKHEPATYPLYVTGALPGEDTALSFVPRNHMESDLAPLTRPKFLAIVSSNTLATTMLRKSNGKVDGLVIEGHIAGGHNAPPRGKLQVSESGEAVYGERDRVDIPKIAELGVPFWLAGGFGNAEKLSEAIAAGAAGVQVGTAFALCAESGLDDEFKQALLDLCVSGAAKVATDLNASPTGFPFKCAQLPGSLSDSKVYTERSRLCDVGVLREAYRTADGSIGYRCAAEAPTVYLAKGGKVEDTNGKQCLCNALLANIGQAQLRNDNYQEKALVTLGADLTCLKKLTDNKNHAYTASEVVTALLGS